MKDKSLRQLMEEAVVKRAELEALEETINTLEASLSGEEKVVLERISEIEFQINLNREELLSLKSRLLIEMKTFPIGCTHCHLSNPLGQWGFVTKTWTQSYGDRDTCYSNNAESSLLCPHCDHVVPINSLPSKSEVLHILSQFQVRQLFATHWYKDLDTHSMRKEG
jgi:Zn finger protein HypA/HybF involved in hydrogenase expression